MTSCDYCDSVDTEQCDECPRVVCPDHRHESGQVVLCVPPDHDVYVGRGCCKPLVADVIENDLQTLSVAGLLRIQRASQED